MDDKASPRFDGKNCLDADGNVLNLQDPKTREALKSKVMTTKDWRSLHG